MMVVIAPSPVMSAAHTPRIITCREFTIIMSLLAWTFPHQASPIVSSGVFYQMFLFLRTLRPHTRKSGIMRHDGKNNAWSTIHTHLSPPPRHKSPTTQRAATICPPLNEPINNVYITREQWQMSKKCRFRHLVDSCSAICSHTLYYSYTKSHALITSIAAAFPYTKKTHR
jgi:hypothetical protein